MTAQQSEYRIKMVASCPAISLTLIETGSVKFAIAGARRWDPIGIYSDPGPEYKSPQADLNSVRRLPHVS